jgi:hypothetical protein
MNDTDCPVGSIPLRRSGRRWRLCCGNDWPVVHVKSRFLGHPCGRFFFFFFKFHYRAPEGTEPYVARFLSTSLSNPISCPLM